MHPHAEYSIQGHVAYESGHPNAIGITFDSLAVQKSNINQANFIFTSISSLSIPDSSMLSNTF